ncbi:MAG: alkaline phosphatase [Alphaproteobacteria bacterium]|nr:alkaline phosphatase [Alphaproteobacteria bacterium]
MFPFLFSIKKAKHRLLLGGFCLMCCLLNACQEEKLAKYVFLFIGDGASYAQRRLTELAEGKHLFVNTLPVQGVATAASAKSNLADTASSAGALATGQLGAEGMISMLSENEPALPLITSVVAEKGYAVGIIADSFLDGAVPASFYAHSAKKQNYYDIAVQTKDSGISLMIGQAFKRQKSFQKEDLGVVLKNGGYKQLFSLQKDEVLPSGKVIASLKNIPFAIDAKPEAPSLAMFVQKAIDKFQGEKGFVLITIGSKMNQAAGMHDTAALIKEINAFDQAVQAAWDFYHTHDQETLIIVTGTVETGGLTLGVDNSGDLKADILKNQNISADAFKPVISRFRQRRQAGAVLEDFMPQIEKNFGLRILSKEQKKELNAKAKAGDEEAKKALEMNLSAAELSGLREAFRYSMMEPAKRPKTEAYVNKYDKYDPLQIAPAQILARRAGLGYSTFGQTGVPVPVSAIGNGAFFFMGNYPQTALFGKLLKAMGITVQETKPLQEEQK